MKQLFSNNARTTVASTFGATDTTLEVLDGSLFPVPNEAGQFFLLTLLRIDGNNQETGHEVIKCNARVGNSITVEQRAYEGAAASEFAVGSVVSARLTAKSMENLIAASIAAVELIYDNFDDRYLGAKAADPATDNDGDPLEDGMLYFNTTALIMRVYGGGAWQDAASAVEGLGQTFQFTATAGQAEFTGNDDSGAALTFDSVGNLMVFLNGVRLVRNIDYSVNDVDKIITLVKSASDLDVLTVDAFSYFATVPLADKAMAEAGTDNASLMTPLRTAQAINAMPRKNYIINGNFDIWQRGISSTSGFLADRWFNNTSGGGAFTASRQLFSLGQTDVPGSPKYFHSHSRTTAATSPNNPLIQRIESVLTLSGQKATLSFYAKAGTAKEFNLAVAQAFGTGGAPSSAVSLPLIPLAITTAWKKFTIKFDVPSITGKTLGTDGNDYLQIAIQETDGFSVFTLDVAQVQLEKGSIATDFEYRDITEERLLCKRYCAKGRWSLRGYASVAGARLSASIPLGVEMRASPTVTTNGGTVLNTPVFVGLATHPTEIRPEITANAIGDFYVLGSEYLADAEL